VVDRFLGVEVFLLDVDDPMPTVLAQEPMDCREDSLAKPIRSFLLGWIPVLGARHDRVHIDAFAQPYHAGMLQAPVGPAISGIGIEPAIRAGEIAAVQEKQSDQMIIQIPKNQSTARSG